MGAAIRTSEVIFVGIVGLIVLFLVVTLVRRRLIAGHAVPVLCALRLPGSRWHAGLLKVTSSSLMWFPLFGVTARARHVWLRGALDVAGETRPVEASETIGAFVGVSRPLRVHFTVAPRPTVDGRTFQLVMSPDNYTAVRAWLEAGPPMDWRVEG